MSKLIDDFKNKISSYDKEYEFSQEEVLNILARYEIKYRNVQSISLDKIKKAREEIENLAELSSYTTKTQLIHFNRKVLDILDKLIAESEDSMNEKEELKIGDVVVDRVGKRVGIVIGFDERRDYIVYLLTCSSEYYFQTLESSKHMWTKTGIAEPSINNIMNLLDWDKIIGFVNEFGGEIDVKEE